MIAPTATLTGDTLHRVAPRYSLALFPFVPVAERRSTNGAASPFPHYEAPDERAAIVAMLAELHRATPTVGSLPRTLDLEVPGRRGLDAALGGSSAAPGTADRTRNRHGRCSRVTLQTSSSCSLLRSGLRPTLRGVAQMGDHARRPHARNVLRTEDGRGLVDWDTVAVGPPERDLWMLMDSSTDVALYEAQTGHELDTRAGDFFRLLWDLSDLASYLAVIRVPHREDEDTARAYRCITECVSSRDRWSELLADR